MVSLSLFIGQILSDLANARTNADYATASASEQYHADPFVKNLPIPHYIIDEAEVEVPVMVVGVTKQSSEFAKQEKLLLESIRNKLPLCLIRSYKFNYVRERETERQQADTQNQASEKVRFELDKTNQMPDQKKRENLSKYKFSDQLLKSFNESANSITKRMVVHIQEYLDTYNYEIIKLLDLSEDFIAQLIREIKMDLRTYPNDQLPYYTDESISRSADYVGNIMFFDFKKIMKSDAGVNIDVQTVQMNEYATNNCLMHIKLKIKEQDLNVIIEESDNGKERRYLSLT